MRKLVTVRQVEALTPIEGADFIELAVIDGWQCVVKKGEFQVGNLGVYYEIDSALPADDERYAFLKSRGVKKLNGNEVLRIKTMKLKGSLSQGLLLPITAFEDEIERAIIDAQLQDPYQLYTNEIPLEEYLGVVKYEKEFVGGSRDSAGLFPWWVRKTDAERIQNEFKRLKHVDQEKWYAATLKLDGSSTTVAYVTDEKYFSDKLEVDEDGGQMFVCSRNNILKPCDENRWWVGCKNSGLLDAVKKFHLETGRTLAVQGELVGPGIQRNHENHDTYKVYAFSIWDVDAQEYVDYAGFVSICDDGMGIEMTPLITTFQLSEFASVQDYLDFAEGIESPFTDCPEGVVFHELWSEEKGGTHHFKSISNRFLLETKG